MNDIIELRVAHPGWEASVDVQRLKRIGAGGLANVYRFDRSRTESYALKLYREPQKADWQRIEFLTKEFGPRADRRSSIGRIAWPIGRIDRTGTPVGIALPLFDAARHRALDCWIEPPLQKKLTPAQDALSTRLTVIKNLASMLAELHDDGLAVVDLKPSNILVADDLSIIMLDADSFGVRRANGVRFPPTHVSASYIAPEAYTDHLDVASLWHEQDCYAFAVIAFQVLNYGVHPFQCILDQAIAGTDTNDEKARSGLYAYGLTSHPLAQPVRASVHTTWPSSLRLLFDRAFAARAERPSAGEWRDAIGDILEVKRLTRCDAHPNNVQHIRFEGMLCARCMRDTANAAIVAEASKGPDTVQGNARPTPTETSRGYTYKPPPAGSADRTGHGIALALAAGVVLLLVMYGRSNSPPNHVATHSPPAPSATQPRPAPPSASPPPPSYAPTYGEWTERWNHGAWTTFQIVAPNGSRTCALAQSANNGAKTVGMLYVKTSGRWLLFVEDRQPPPDPLKLEIDRRFSQDFTVSGRARSLGDSGEYFNQAFYNVNQSLADAFVAGNNMIVGGVTWSLSGSASAFTTFANCARR